MASEKMFTSLRFFFKGTLNYVYIDLKKSPSNLTLGQCKFDIRPISKACKPCQVIYYSTCLDGIKMFKLFVVTLDQRTITTNKTSGHSGRDESAFCVRTLN